MPGHDQNCGSATTPAGPLAWQAGGGGGTSYNYTQPFYQAGVVPSALALRNEALFGPVPLRVVPDISMDADAQSGMLIGLTQTFPKGVYYDQFKEGGTSLASPLLAGVIADADQAAGAPLGFLNPALYKASTGTPAAFNDIKPPAKPELGGRGPGRLRQHGQPLRRISSSASGRSTTRGRRPTATGRATAPRAT